MQQSQIEQEQEISIQMEFSAQKPSQIPENFTQIAEGCGSRIFKSQISKKIIKATKHKHDKKSGHELACSLLKNEFKIVQKLDHENIIKYDSYEKNKEIAGKAYCSIQMEEMESDLFDFYCSNNNNQQFNSIQQFQYVFQKILKAVAYIHSQNVSHNDIKPENIFIKKNQQQQQCFASQLKQQQHSQQLDNSFDLELEFDDDEDDQYDDCSTSSSSLENSPQNTQKKKQQVIQEYEPILADFGFANVEKTYSSDVQSQTLFWKKRDLAFMGGEVSQFLQNQQQQKCFDEFKNDIFSLGQTFFMCVAKKYPRYFMIPTEKCPIYGEISQQNLHGFWMQVKDFCPMFSDYQGCAVFLDLCMKMMGQNPEKRPSAQECLEHPFFQL